MYKQLYIEPVYCFALTQNIFILLFFHYIFYNPQHYTATLFLEVCIIWFSYVTKLSQVITFLYARKPSIKACLWSYNTFIIVVLRNAKHHQTPLQCQAVHKYVYDWCSISRFLCCNIPLWQPSYECATRMVILEHQGHHSHLTLVLCQ